MLSADRAVCKDLLRHRLSSFLALLKNALLDWHEHQERTDYIQDDSGNSSRLQGSRMPPPVVLYQ